jgi:hypothetical protein
MKKKPTLESTARELTALAEKFLSSCHPENKTAASTVSKRPRSGYLAQNRTVFLSLQLLNLELFNLFVP